MADELNNDIQTVDVNTDDLDAFNDLLNGKAKMAEPESEDNKDGDVNADENTDVTPENEVDTPAENAPPEETDKPRKEKGRFQERIDELTARAREAERREAEALRRAQELEDRTKTQPAPRSENDQPKPDAKNEDGSDKYPLGEFDPDYIRDLTRHTIEKETKAATEKAELEKVNRQNQEARQQLDEQWQGKLSEATADKPDFLDKVVTLESAFDGLDQGYSDYLVQTIKSLDHGPEVLYHFANNVEEAKKFVRMGPLQATLALGEINARFRKSQSEPTQRPTQAPTPPPAPNKGASSRKTIAADTDDLDDFITLFNAKNKRR